MDQTGVNLVPASHWTYEQIGSNAVATVGAEDKRQITACLASSLHGDLLPLQLVFEGKSTRSLPEATAASKAARVHLTHSPNHWSSQETMQQWVNQVLMTYADRCISAFQLNTDAHILLILDVWAVHKSEEFRRFLRTHHPRVHLVFVPPNCTSKLQVADAALQRPFKSALRRCFDAWASEQTYQRMRDNALPQLSASFGMKTLKPLVLQWCIDSWAQLQQRKEIIAAGWYSCCLSLYDVHNREKRIAAVAAVAKRELDATHVPDGEEEPPKDEETDHESDEEKDELDLAKPIPEPEKRSQRARKQTNLFGYRVNPERIAMTDDSN